MNRTFKPRLAGFALAIVIVALMIGWAAHASWRQFDQLSRKLTEMQIESFKLDRHPKAHSDHGQGRKDSGPDQCGL